MKLDLDPEKNRQQFEKLRAFSASNMLVFRKGLWLFMGLSFTAASILIYFGDPSSIQGGTKEEVALQFLAIGLGIISVTLVVSYLWNKIGEYTPKPNNGDEWLK